MTCTQKHACYMAVNPLTSHHHIKINICCHSTRRLVCDIIARSVAGVIEHQSFPLIYKSVARLHLMEKKTRGNTLRDRDSWHVKILLDSVALNESQRLCLLMICFSDCFFHCAQSMFKNTHCWLCSLTVRQEWILGRVRGGIKRGTGLAGGGLRFHSTVHKYEWVFTCTKRSNDEFLPFFCYFLLKGWCW